MSCIKTLDTNASTGILSGIWTTTGIFDFMGYATTEGGTYGAGGNWPWISDVWGASIDSDNLVSGFYKLKYRTNLPESDDCYAEVEIIIPVVQGATGMGTIIEIDLCSADSARNIFDDSGLFSLSSVLPVSAAISGTGTSSPGYSAGGAGIEDDEFDPSLELSYPQTYDFVITFTPEAPVGYSLVNCDECVENSMTVRYNIEESFSATGEPHTSCNDGDL